MTIAYLAAIRFPNTRGHGIQIQNTVEALMRRGVSVTMVVPSRDAEGETLIPIEKIPVPDTVSAGFFGYLTLLIRFAFKTLSSNSVKNADIVYSRDAMLLLPHLVMGRRCVYECHAPTLGARILLPWVPVIAISEGLCNWGKEHGGKRVVYAPDAVSVSMFDGNNAVLEDDQPTIVYAGTLYPRKGAWVLAAAAALLPQCRVIVHGGPAKEREDMAKQYPQAVYAGAYSHGDLPRILQNASIVVIPNVASDQDAALYTSPMKLFEAMASNTPIVASDVPSLRSVLSDEMAYFFTPENPVDLARVITEVLGDPTRIEKAARAREEVLKYTWDTRAEIIEKYIASL